MSENNKGSFDRLVAGLSSEDRHAMLERINQQNEQPIRLSNEQNDSNEQQISLQKKLEQESLFYKVLLWFRSFFSKQPLTKLYCDDLLLSQAKKISRNYPGLINPNINSFDYIFYERLRGLKDASDFFKPYINFIEDNLGDFYVFLSSFVAPELSEQINQTADPFNTPFDTEATNDLRNNHLKNLEEVLSNMIPQTKENIYISISAANWLKNFTMLPFIHFLASFTNVTGDVYTCPYKAAVLDYNALASVFYHVTYVQNEVLEAIFLFSQRKSLGDSVLEKEIERQTSEFMNKAIIHMEAIQSFIESVPIRNVGRIINNSYDWQPEPMNGAEAWFPTFRAQWKKIIDVRWNEWVKAQKKQQLGESFKKDFGLSEFPILSQRPWTNLWTTVVFRCELTAGFLGWFTTECYNETMSLLTGVATDGIFYKNENRTEYSDALNSFSLSMNKMLNLIQQLSPDGVFGKIFQDFSTTKVHTFQVQKQIDSMMKQTEKDVRESYLLFCKSIKTIDSVFHGIFDEAKDGVHEGLQNLNTIKGRNTRQFLDALINVRKKLNKALFYIGELESIDNVSD